MAEADPLDKIKALHNDVDNIVEMYDFAEKMYPYTNITGRRHDNERRQRELATASYYNNPDNLFTEPSFGPVMFVYMMSRTGANGVFDLS